MPISTRLCTPSVAEDGRPREQEHRLDGEHHVEEREDVVADLGLHPVAADRVDTGLVRRQLLEGRLVRAQQPVGPDRGRQEGTAHEDHQPHHGVGTEVAAQHNRSLRRFARVCSLGLAALILMRRSQSAREAWPR